jgi:hypothetical protein
VAATNSLKWKTITVQAGDRQQLQLGHVADRCSSGKTTVVGQNHLEIAVREVAEPFDQFRHVLIDAMTGNDSAAIVGTELAS